MDATAAKETPKKLRDARLACALKQEELAQRASVSSQTVSNIETGRHKPTLETLIRFARVLGVGVEDLL